MGDVLHRTVDCTSHVDRQATLKHLEELRLRLYGQQDFAAAANFFWGQKTLYDGSPVHYFKQATVALCLGDLL